MMEWFNVDNLMNANSCDDFYVRMDHYRSWRESCRPYVMQGVMSTSSSPLQLICSLSGQTFKFKKEKEMAKERHYSQDAKFGFRCHLSAFRQNARRETAPIMTSAASLCSKTTAPVLLA